MIWENICFNCNYHTNIGGSCKCGLNITGPYLSKELRAERNKSQQLARDKGDMRIEIQDLKRKIEATLAYQELLLDALEEMEKKLQAEREKSEQQFDIGYKHGVREGRGDFKSDLVEEKEDKA